MDRIAIGNRVYEVRRVSSITRRTRVSLSGRVVTIRVPALMPRNLQEREFARMRKRTERSLRSMRQPIAIGEGSLSLMERRFTVSVVHSGVRNVRCTASNGSVTVKLPMGASAADNASTVSRAARRAISRELLPAVCEMVERSGALMGVSPGKVALKDTRTRWGSCNTRNGNISLDFRLLYAPLPVLEYVVAHELCHLKHPDHSRRFWSAVEGAFPDYRAARGWIRDNGCLLGDGSAVPPFRVSRVS